MDCSFSFTLDLTFSTIKPSLNGNLFRGNWLIGWDDMSSFPIVRIGPGLSIWLRTSYWDMEAIPSWSKGTKIFGSKKLKEGFFGVTPLLTQLLFQACHFWDENVCHLTIHELFACGRSPLGSLFGYVERNINQTQRAFPFICMQEFVRGAKYLSSHYLAV